MCALRRYACQRSGWAHQIIRFKAEVLKRLDDADWSVREQLAASLGVLPAGPRETALVSVLERFANDAIVVDASLSGLRGSESAVLDKLMASPTQTPQRETAITMLAATIVRGGQDAAIQKLFRGLGGRKSACLATVRGSERS